MSFFGNNANTNTTAGSGGGNIFGNTPGATGPGTTGSAFGSNTATAGTRIIDSEHFMGPIDKTMQRSSQQGACLARHRQEGLQTYLVAGHLELAMLPHLQRRLLLPQQVSSEM